MAWDWETGLQEYPGASDPEAARVFLHAMQAVPYTAAGLLAPQVALGGDASNPYNWIPGKGLATGAYSVMTGLAEAGMNYVGKPVAQFLQRTNAPFASVTPTIPEDFEAKIPGSDLATISTKESVNRAFTSLPRVEPTTEGGRLGEELGKGLTQGAMTVAPPGLGMLPRALSLPLKLALPPARTAPVGAALGGASGMIGEALAGEQEPFPVIDLEKKKKEQEPFPIIKLGDTSAVAPGQPTSDNDSGWSYLKTGAALTVGSVAAWAIAKYGPGKMNVVADMLRGRTRDIAAANEKLAQGLPLSLKDKAIEMPLPGDAGGLSHRMAMENINPNAVVNKFAEATMPPADALVQKAVNETINNPANSNRRMESLFRTGVEEGTNHTFPKIIEYKRATEALTPGQMELADKAAWYKSELNLRNQNVIAMAKEGTAWRPELDETIRVNMPHMKTDDLRAAVELAERDPQIKAWLDLHKSIPTAIINSMETRGHITPAQATRARMQYPDFMPTIDAEGRIRHSWDDKILEAGSGYRDPPAPAWQAMINHFDRTIRAAQHNEWQRGIVLNWFAKQEADPSLPRLLTETRAPKGSTPGIGHNSLPEPVQTLNRNIAINTADGVRYFDINNSAFARSLKQSPQMGAVTSQTANWLRRFYQNATTGPLGTVMGSPYMVKNVLRDVVLIPAQAGKYVWRGELDKLLKTRLPYDPTFIPGTAITMGRDVGAVTAKNLGDILSNRNNPFAAVLRNVFGHDQIDALSDWMRSQFQLSKLAKREALGVGGGGNRTALNMSSYTQDTGGTFRDPTANAVSPLMGPHWLDNIADRVPIPGNIVKQGAVGYINLRTLARDLYGVISDAPHNYLFDVNRGNPKVGPRAMAAEVQRVTGDPGTVGLGKFAQNMGRNVPWYNTSLQAMAAAGRTMRDRPIATGATIASILIPFAIAEHLSALVSGKEHVEDLENRTTNSTKARSAILYHGPGTDPTVHTVWPMPQEWMPIWPYVSGAVGHALGTWTAHDDMPTLERLATSLGGLTDDHMTTDILKQMGIGLAAGYSPIDATVPMGLIVGATTGQELKNIPEQLISNYIAGAPLGSNMTMGGGPTQTSPGQGGHDSLLFRADSGVLKAVMSALGAAVGNAYDMATGFDRRAKVDSEWDWAMHGLWEDYKQEWKDNTPYGNFIWQNSLQRSSHGSLEERNDAMWHNVQQTTGAAADLRGEGFARSTGSTVPLVMNNDGKVPDDPAMRTLYLRMSDVGKAINREIEPKISELKTQIDNTRKSAFMPEEKRNIMNDLSNKLYQQNVKKHEWLLNLNSQLSELAGGRHVDVGQSIDWQGSIEQFHH